MYKPKKNPFKKVWFITLTILVGIISLSHTICTIKAFVNYDYNVVAWAEYAHSGIINDQHDFAKLKFGFGNIGANGCGAISVYNILVLENREKALPDIIKQFDLCGENIFGVAGSKPTRVVRVLKNYGFNVSYSLNKNKFENIAQNSKYSIYVYVGKDQGTLVGHYQLIYNYNGERYDTINTNGNYTYQEIINVPNSIFSMMIGVNP